MTRDLPVLLSVIAGAADVIGLLTFSLFTAHVTGNLVVIAALIVRGGPPHVAQVLAVPAFMLAVAVTWLIAKWLGAHGLPPVRPLLAVQFLLLLCVQALSVIGAHTASRHGLITGAASMMAISAMACQFSLPRLAMSGAPSTAVMTGNLTNAVLSSLDTLVPTNPLTGHASDRLRKTSRVLIGFFGGCLAGAAAVSWLAEWAWSLPVVLAGIALVRA